MARESVWQYGDAGSGHRADFVVTVTGGAQYSVAMLAQARRAALR
jgi:hypothetical protein